MKKNLLIFLGICSSLVAVAQFEGTVLWGFKMNITDSKMKAQMAQAEKEMNDPETQAKMKELEAQMNDPQFKQMLESNPEMKKLVESQIAIAKSGSTGGSLMDNFIPKNLEVKIKGVNSLTKVMGGAFESEVLYLKDKGQSYLLNRKEKTYYAPPKDKEAKTSDAKVTKTEEFATIQGYKCRKYLVETTVHGQKIVSDLWATTDIKDMDFKHFSKMKIGTGASFMEKIEGMPIKMQVDSPQGQMVMEVVSLKKENLATSLFEIPTDFKETKTLPTMGY